MAYEITLKNRSAYDWIRYKDGYWISHRKRVYLYWFKYLQHAELSPNHEVDWTQYSGWGGANAVLGMKFDEWWNDNWIELFGTKDRSATPKYPINTKQPKTEAIRLSMLCWERRDAPVWNKRGNALSIAKQVYEYELGISGEKKPRHGDDEFTAGSMNPDTFEVMAREKVWDPELKKYVYTDGEYVSDPQRLQSIVSRYLKNARKYLNNVCVRKFP